MLSEGSKQNVGGKCFDQTLYTITLRNFVVPTRSVW